MKFRLAAVIAGLFVAALGAWLVYGRRRPLNILVLSTCSVRWDYLGPYGANPNFSANLSKFGKSAFVFENAVTDVSWSNVLGFLSYIEPASFAEHGYHAIGNPWSKWDEDTQQVSSATPPYYYKSGAFALSPLYQKDMAEVKKRVLDRKNWPFILEFHVKIMHLPYHLLEWPFGAETLVYLAPEQREYLEHYFHYPERYPDRILLYLLLGRRSPKIFELLRRLPLGLSLDTVAQLENNTNHRLVELVNNREFLARWQKSPFYSRDVEIVKAIYKLRLWQLDHYLAELLNGFEDKDFLNNTVIIFTGDHGEGFGEHGLFAHLETPYDELLRFPLMVKFPETSTSTRIQRQFFQGSIRKIVESIMNDNMNGANFMTKLEKFSPDDNIISKNCANTQFGVRRGNEWKLIMDLISNEKQLYHLTTDPMEKTNVFDRFPKIAADLESYWLVHARDQANNREHLCRYGAGE